MIYKSYCDVFCQNSCFCVFSAFMENWIFGPSVFPVLFMGTFLENDNAHIPWSLMMIHSGMYYGTHWKNNDTVPPRIFLFGWVNTISSSFPHQIQLQITCSDVSPHLVYHGHFICSLLLLSHTHMPLLLWFICSFPYYCILTQNLTQNNRLYNN